MKIGILIGKFEKLSNWELQIIEKIINDKEFKLSLLIQDGRETKNIEKSHAKFTSLLRTKNTLSKLIFKIQILIEQRLFKEHTTIDRKSIIGKLNTVDTVHLKPKRKGFYDVFSSVDAEKIKSYNLDVILRHEFNSIRGDILNSAKYGIWTFDHVGNSPILNSYSGFWEILFHHTSVAINLQQLTPQLNAKLVIAETYSNFHWSYVKTNRLIKETSISLLFKHLRQVQINNYSPTKSIINHTLTYKTPNLNHILRYIFNFYFKISSKVFERLRYLFLGIRYDCWTLFIGEGDFLNSSLYRLKPVTLPKNELWADPFIFNCKNENYIFFENYNYLSKKGKISCGRIKDNDLVDIKDVLNLDYHLSYPFIFEDKGDIFLMPETYYNNRLEIYKCISFPNKWELYTTAFEGEKVVDASIFLDENNQKWLFINKQESELFIYKIDSIKLEHLEPHLQNPVIVNSKTARNGGAIFKYKGEIYRPSQANIEGVYGRALNINKIVKLTIDEYNEETIETFFPNFHKGLISMHHLHQTNGLFVIDAAYKKK